MATETVSTTAAESKSPEHRYYTRYGIKTAPEAALNLLQRACERLQFLEEVFAVVHQEGEGFTMKGYSALGLAGILEDIAHDVNVSHTYYIGEDPEPGKDHDMPEVRS